MGLILLAVIFLLPLLNRVAYGFEIEVSFLNPHTHKPWVDPTHVGRCGLHKLVSDSRGYFVGSRNSKVKQKCTENAILLYIMQAI